MIIEGKREMKRMTVYSSERMVNIVRHVNDMGIVREDIVAITYNGNSYQIFYYIR